MTLVIIISCKYETKKNNYLTEYTNNKSLSNEDSIEMYKRDSVILISSDLRENPPSEITLKRWKEKVKKEADDYYYTQLIFYYSENPQLIDEMIEYSEIMINKSKKNAVYIIDYYDYVKNSNSQQKDKLMVKAIEYLEKLLKTEGYTAFQAKVRLSELYREGIYVKKDTIVANYLKNGGIRLDSIIQARSK